MKNNAKNSVVKWVVFFDRASGELKSTPEYQNVYSVYGGWEVVVEGNKWECDKFLKDTGRCEMCGLPTSKLEDGRWCDFCGKPIYYGLEEATVFSHGKKVNGEEKSRLIKKAENAVHYQQVHDCYPGSGSYSGFDVTEWDILFENSQWARLVRIGPGFDQMRIKDKSDWRIAYVSKPAYTIRKEKHIDTVIGRHHPSVFVCPICGKENFCIQKGNNYEVYGPCEGKCFHGNADGNIIYYKY